MIDLSGHTEPSDFKFTWSWLLMALAAAIAAGLLTHLFTGAPAKPQHPTVIKVANPFLKGAPND